MAAVAATVLAGPASVVYVLGPAAALLLPSVGAMLGVNLGLGVHPGFYTKPDRITSKSTIIVTTLAWHQRHAGLHRLVVAPSLRSRHHSVLCCLLLPAAVLHDVLEEGGGLLFLHPLAEAR